MNITIENLWIILTGERNTRVKYLKDCLREIKLTLHGPKESDLKRIKIPRKFDKLDKSDEFGKFLADPDNNFPQDFSSIAYYKNKARNDEIYATIYEKEKDRRRKIKEELHNIQKQINFLEKLPKRINVTDDSFIEKRKLPAVLTEKDCDSL